MTDESPAVLAMRRRANRRRVTYLLSEIGQVSPRVLRLAYAELTPEQRANLDALLDQIENRQREEAQP